MVDLSKINILNDFECKKYEVINNLIGLKVVVFCFTNLLFFCGNFSFFRSKNMRKILQFMLDGR